MKKSKSVQLAFLASFSLMLGTGCSSNHYDEEYYDDYGYNTSSYDSSRPHVVYRSRPSSSFFFWGRSRSSPSYSYTHQTNVHHYGSDGGSSGSSSSGLSSGSSSSTSSRSSSSGSSSVSKSGTSRGGFGSSGSSVSS